MNNKSLRNSILFVIGLFVLINITFLLHPPEKDLDAQCISVDNFGVGKSVAPATSTCNYQPNSWDRLVTVTMNSGNITTDGGLVRVEYNGRINTVIECGEWCGSVTKTRHFTRYYLGPSGGFTACTNYQVGPDCYCG